MKKKLQHYLGWKLAHFLFWLGNKLSRFDPSNLGSRVCDWMERNHVCCDRHGYKG